MYLYILYIDGKDEGAELWDLAHKAPPIECKTREMTTIGRIFKRHKSNLCAPPWPVLRMGKKKKICIFYP